MNHSAKDIAARLAERVEEIAKYLLPNGKKVGSEWRVGSLAGEVGESLGVHLSGSKAGIFCDFATGESGDLLTLWAKNRNLTIKDAISEAKGWLGIGSTFKFHHEIPKTFKRPSLSSTLKPVSASSPVGQYLIQERKLCLETLHVFKVYEKQNEIVFPYYRDQELVQLKYLNIHRPQGKKVIRVEAHCEPCLFGWDTLPPDAREITICEGELDAMSLFHYGIPALSVPFGGGTGAKQQWIEHEFDRLSMFDKIYLCLDHDEAGLAATREIIQRLGSHRCVVVTLPFKDANACLQAGVMVDEIQRYFREAKSLDPQELKSAHLFVDGVIHAFYGQTEAEKGFLPPWDKAKGKIAFRPDELSIWTGVNGHGKSQVLGQIVLSTMKQGGKVCIASLELKPERLLMRLARQASGLAKPTKGYLEAIHQWYHDRLWLFDLVGNAKSERLLDVFRYARQRYGVTVFVIDSLMKLDIAEDDYKKQKDFLEKLCDFKNELNCHVHLVVHPRKGVDEHRNPSKLDVKGSGAITDLADNCFTVWRNKAKEAEVQKLVLQKKAVPDELTQQSDCLWICDKQRNGEWEGKVGLWFDSNSFQYFNHASQKPIQYVDYSNPQTP